MKKILGLDLGTTSIGWALVNEASSSDEQSSIIKLGVRVIPLTVDEQQNFEKGKSITTNADRTLKRGMRRNLQRYKLRRKELIEVLLNNGIITNETSLVEEGDNTTHQTLALRAKAAEQIVSLEEFARILLLINKKRGYKSNRKMDSAEDGEAVDDMQTAKYLRDHNLTPGQYVYERLCEGKYASPAFYQSDLNDEFDSIWRVQSNYYPDILTQELKDKLEGKNKTQTWSICKEPFSIVGIKRATKGKEQTKENYKWRTVALSKQIGLEELAIVFQEIKNQIKNASGYLGTISDRSKVLYFENITVGQYQYSAIKKDRHHSLKNEVFYRQDYIDEFNRIWAVQSSQYSCLTDKLKRLIYDIIFYQRPLKSQKNLISLCEFENSIIEVTKDGKTSRKVIGMRVAPKSSPIFQEFKIWQTINNLRVNGNELSLEDKHILAQELSIKERLTKNEILKLLYSNHKELSLNFEKVEGNKTQASFFNAYSQIITQSGHGEYDFSKMKYDDIISLIKGVFSGLGFKTNFLSFDSSLSGNALDSQPFFKLWHLIYSYQGDNSTSGNEKLVDKISALCGIDREYAKIIAKIKLPDDYGSLSTKAMKRILPFLKEGMTYSDAVLFAYDGALNHSKSSLTKEQLDQKEYKDHLEILPKNSLRNPVVEKILNQMVNVVNQVIDMYGKPDEIRLEMARELKKSAKEREEMTSAISRSTIEHEKYRKVLSEQYQISNPTRNDIIRYRLYLELEKYGYKTLYSGVKINGERLFSKDYDIEHIIPQSRLFDDSFANKTLELRDINIEKGNRTAYDFVKAKYGEEGLSQYLAKVDGLVKDGIISRTKAKNLKMTEKDIPEDFISRELRDSQYIAKKAKSMLEDVVKFVVTTTGSITDRLRQDWQLVDVMKELNWDKYNKIGKTFYREDRDGRRIKEIEDWTKRNDHRHHAMDALTIAFTKRSYIQYLNNLNARINKDSHNGSFVDLKDYSLYNISASERTDVVMFIQANQMVKDKDGHWRFISPILPIDRFRQEAKEHLQNILISIKAKNKVVTKNDNITKSKSGNKHKIQLTPRGQLHNETIYGCSLEYVTKIENVGSTFSQEKIMSVASSKYRELLLKRLMEYDGNPKKAFTGKNTLEKNPIYIDPEHLEAVPTKITTVNLERRYTIRKPISKDLKIDKVVDEGIRTILKRRLEEYGGDADKAFSNLDDNPIWLNKEKGISIKRVTIYGVNNAVALHDNKDFVSTGNNHHVAIFKDSEGHLQEQIVSFYEAVVRVNLGDPIIDTEYRRNDGWEFLFSMKQNEYFVLPDLENGFNPKEIDLLDPNNYSLISPHLFRVQKLATKNYTFRHHLETNVEEKTELRGIAWERIQSVDKLENFIKVRVNHIGQIVAIGEYV